MLNALTEKDRSIDKLYNFKTGNEKSAVRILNSWNRSQSIVRRKIEEGIQSKSTKYGCFYCGQVVKLSSHKPKTYSGPIYYFKHLNDSGDCIIKKDTSLTYDIARRIKYYGAKESNLHIEIKKHIFDNLETDDRFYDLAKEKYIRSSKGWGYGRRRPDVSAKFLGFQMAFEIQVSTEFLSVIASREMFYAEELSSILWVFWEFDPNNHKTRKTMHDDIISSNHMNALSISENSKRLTKSEGELVFDGHYCIPEYDYTEKEITQKWLVKPVKIGDLVFDIKTKKPYFSHYETLLKIENRKKSEHNKEREDDEKKKREIERKAKRDCIIGIESNLFVEWDNISNRTNHSKFIHNVKDVFGIDLTNLDEEEWLINFNRALRAAFSIRDRCVRVQNQHGRWRWLINDILLYDRAKYYMPLAKGLKKQGLLFEVFDSSDFTELNEEGLMVMDKPRLSSTAKKHLEVVKKLRSGKLKIHKDANLLLEIIATDQFKKIQYV